MSYLLVQIWILLLLAALIGLIAGWFLRGGARHKIDRVSQEWSQRLANIEAERDEYAQKNSEMGAASVRQGEMFLKLSDERDVLSRRLLEHESGSEVDQQTVSEYRERLSQHEVEVSQLKDQLLETANQLTETQQSLHVVRGQTDSEALSLQGSAESQDLTAKLSETESLLIERDQTIDQLHQKLATNLADLNETKENLTKNLNDEREKAQTAAEALEETKRLKEEYEEQLKCSENSLQDVTSELKQKQEFFEVSRRELDTKLKNSGQQFESVNATIREQSEQLKQQQLKLEAREASLKSTGEREGELQKTVNRMSEQLEQTQKALTESSQKQQSLESELRTSQLEVTKLQTQADTPQPPRDYSEIASGMMAGAAGTTMAKSDGLATGWSKLSDLARDGFQKVKVKVEDTTTEVVTASAKASPNDDNYRIEVIRSIGNDNRRLLHDMGVNTTFNLLNKCQDPEGIKLISKALGRESWVVSSWASIADLLRVKGIDGGMAEVLELSGVYSVQSLAEANPEKLLQSIKSVNERVEKVASIPDISIISGWVQHAAELDEWIA
ncbi:MAG: DUF4332 domain-containing protein [Leucothrix sp.]